MSLLSLLGGNTVRQNLEEQSSRIYDAILWRALLVLAVMFLVLAAWRILEGLIGPILAPLTMAAALAMVAGALAYLDARRKRSHKQATPSVTPIIATLLEIAFAPKLVRWFAIGSLVVDVLSRSSPLSASQKQGQRKVR
jgi:hypothetical protein